MTICLVNILIIIRLLQQYVLYIGVNIIDCKIHNQNIECISAIP